MDYIGKLRAHIGSDIILIPGTRVLILNEKNQVLLQKRSDFLIYGLPGGSPEENEGAVDTIKREAFEETGLDLLDIKPFAYASDPDHEIITYPSGDKIHNYSICFYCKSYEGKMIDQNEETLELGWYDLDRLPYVIDNHKRTIQAYAKFCETGEFQLI